jgi:dolichol-phosphate mannosyltransferase
LTEKGNSPSVLVILAALNEETGIGPSLMELREVLGDSRHLVIDGNSVDRTVEVAKEFGAEVLLQRGSGKGQAIAQAIKHVNSDKINYVIFSDADYTYPAKYIPEMIRILEENPEVGMVTGNRFNGQFNFNSMNRFFFVGNRLLALTQRGLNGIDLDDPLTGLRVIRWQILKNWEPKSKGFDIEVEINHRVEDEGYTIVEIPIRYRSRLGQKKLGVHHGAVILRRILAESLKRVNGTD